MKCLTSIMVVALMISLCFSVNSVSSSSIETLSDYDFYVDDNFNSSTPGWYITHFDVVQDAVDASSPGDTIFVYNGIYFENLEINVENISLFAENQTNTIIDGGIVDHVINIIQDKITLSGFSIVCGGVHVENEIYGINVLSNNNFITKNIVYNDNDGIYVSNSRGNTVSENTLIGWRVSIFLKNITENVIKENNCNKITISDSANNNVITKNNVSNRVGIQVYDCSNLEISDNIVTNNNYGINIHRSNNIEIIHNFVSNTTYWGIGLEQTNSILVSENTVTQNSLNSEEYNKYGGIWSTASYDIDIKNNNIEGNEIGVLLEYTYNSKISCNNLLNNINDSKSINSFFNRWNNNYWNGPRFLPKKIDKYFIIYSHPMNNLEEDIVFPLLKFDWNPAKQLNEI